MSAPNILAIASYFKGLPFLTRASERGAKVHLLTVEKHLRKEWPREALAGVYAMPNEHQLKDVVNAVSYLARSHRIDRIVALDDFDVETAAHLREHFRMDGMGDSLARLFRDKLAMRVRAKEVGIPIPRFTALFTDDDVKKFCREVPAPWMLKPRSQASATGITKIKSEDELWEVLGSMGDDRAMHLLEAYLPGDVHHVDGITSGGNVLFAEAHRCGTPPFDVAHGGGIFSSHTMQRGTEDDRAIRALNEKVLTSFGLVRSTSHVEFIKGKEDGKFYMLECAARVGGAHISDMVEAATGLNLWREWADLEIDRDKYTLPKARKDYGGLTVCLATQERPDTSSFNDPEIVYRSPEAHHVGLVLKSPDFERARSLVAAYAERLQHEFVAVMPAPTKPSH